MAPSVVSQSASRPIRPTSERAILTVCTGEPAHAPGAPAPTGHGEPHAALRQVAEQPSGRVADSPTSKPHSTSSSRRAGSRSVPAERVGHGAQQLRAAELGRPPG